MATSKVFARAPPREAWAEQALGHSSFDGRNRGVRPCPPPHRVQATQALLAVIQVLPSLKCGSPGLLLASLAFLAQNIKVGINLIGGSSRHPLGLRGFDRAFTGSLGFFIVYTMKIRPDKSNHPRHLILLGAHDGSYVMLRTISALRFSKVLMSS
jgi:hypothetical protein